MPLFILDDAAALAHPDSNAAGIMNTAMFLIARARLGMISLLDRAVTVRRVATRSSRIVKQDAELTLKKERLADAQKKATDAAKELAALEAELGKQRGKETT